MYTEFEKNEIVLEHMGIYYNIAIMYENYVPGFEQVDLIHVQIVAVYQALDKFKGDAKISTYIYITAKNAVRNMRRSEMRAKRRPKHIVYTQTDMVEVLASNKLKDNENTQRCDYLATKRMIEKFAQDSLSKSEYQVYKLMFVKQMERKDVAVKLGMSNRQIGNTIYRIRHKLRTKMEIDYFKV